MASSFCEQMCNSEMLVPAFMFLDSDGQGLNGSGTVCGSPSSLEIAAPYGDEKANLIRYVPRTRDANECFAIVAGIFVARHLKTTEDLFDSKTEPNDGVAGCVGRSMGRADHEENRRRVSITNQSCQRF
jgi:hypothetical protein